MHQTTKKPKLVKELYEEFIQRYSPDEIERTNSLKIVFQYLQNQMTRLNGQFVHVPSEYLQDMIEKHLGYRYEDKVYVK